MIDEKEYKEFLEKNEKGHYAQGLEWARIKSDWKNEVIIVRDEKDKIKASLSLLIRKLPYINSHLMYAPRGPVCDIDDEESFKKLIEEADKLAKKYNAFMLKMDPDILASNEKFKKMSRKNGFIVEEKVKDVETLLQPRYVFRLDLKGKTEEEVFQSFHSKTRYNIRLATKKGVIIKEGTREDLKDFHRIMEVTGKRDDFMIRPLSYFEKMYDELAPEHLKLMMAYTPEGEPISGIIDIIYGNKIWYLYGASSNEHRNLMPNYLLQWNMIKYSIEQKKDMYDFRGVVGVVDESHPQYGLYRFKQGFNAEFTEFIGELYINYKPFTNKMFKISEKLYKKLAGIKTKIKERGK